MEYVLLDMHWNVILNNKHLDFDIGQLAAIHIDENLHTVSTFYRLNARDSKTARQITYMMDVSDDCIMEIETAWKEFRSWLPKDVVFLVWNSEIEHVLDRCNKMFRKKPINAEIGNIQKLQEAMFSIPTSKKSLEDVMKALELTCEQSRMFSALYSVQCMLRLYRKLWKEGRKYFYPYEWDILLISGNYGSLKEREFFSTNVNKILQMECRNAINSFCHERQINFHIRGTRVEIDALQAVWKFDLLNRGEDLAYVPKRYAQIPHYDMKMKKTQKNMLEILQEIFARILSTEERLKYGMGSTEVEALVVELGEGL